MTTNVDNTLAVVIMRAQLPTEAHFKLIEEAKTVGKKVIVLLGSTNRNVSFKNPFNFYQRVAMLKSGMTDMASSVEFVPTPDLPNGNDDRKWRKFIRKTVKHYMRRHFEFKQTVLVAHEKDDSSYYVKSFPEFGLHLVHSFGDYNATDLREILFGASSYTPEQIVNLLGDATREGVKRFLVNYIEEDKPFGYKYVCEQREIINAYKQPYINLPYEPTWLTGDAFVKCGDYILLVKRKDGKYGGGQWAIPGGHVNTYETVDEAITRELIEETTIDVPKRALRNSYVGKLSFEAKGRDERGDFKTTVGIHEIDPLQHGGLPKVKGADDVELALWVHIDEIKTLFLDHNDIVEMCLEYLDVKAYS